MKRSVLFLIFGLALSLISTDVMAQGKMKSPPAESKGTVGKTSVKVNYHAPSARGRVMVGEKEPYGKVWRTGANDATTIEISGDVMVEGKLLKAGRYSLFTVPSETDWTIIFNSVADQWGAYKYDKSKDVLRVTVPSKKSAEFVETLAINVVENGVDLTWENYIVAIGIKG